VTLTATADSGSTFVGWSGDSGCSYGLVLMNANKTCIARFNLKQTTIYISPDGFCNGNTPCYSKIQDGINAAGDGTTIKIVQGIYHENISLISYSTGSYNFSLITNLVIQGGWSNDFSVRTADPALTVVNGDTTGDGIGDGSVFYIDASEIYPEQDTD
jgi:hypothetical protein